jgi:8-oxo-dGTP diphosphatase
MKYATISYLSAEDKVLMMKKKVRENDPNSGLYALPGGKLDSNEKGLDNLDGRLESAIRETNEETGLILIKPKLRGVILFDNKERIFPNWKNPTDFLVYVFSAKNYSGELKGEGNEGTPLWIDERDVPLVPKNAGDELMYGWLKDKRYFEGVIKHKGNILDEDGTFVDYFDRFNISHIASFFSAFQNPS